MSLTRRIKFGEISISDRGEISSLKFGNRELIKGKIPLCEVRLRYKSGECKDISTKDAKTAEEHPGGFVFSGFDEDITVTVSVEGEKYADFFAKVENRIPDALVEWVLMPMMGLSNLKGDGGDHKILLPYNEGAIIDSDTYREKSWFPNIVPEFPSMGCYTIFPNMICSQMLAFLYDGFGILMMTPDEKRSVKGIDYKKREGFISPEWRVFAGARYGENYEMKYPVRVELFEGDWQSAAEIYRDWFDENLPDGAVRIAENADIPAWYRDMPIVVTYPVRGLFDTDVMEPNALFPYENALPLLDRIKKKTRSKIMSLLMHWEGTAPWAPPYVWPPYGGEKMLSDFAEKLHKSGDTLGVYCSGFGFTEQSNLIAEYNNFEALEQGDVFAAFCKAPGNKRAKSRICTAQRSGYDICVVPEISKKILNEAYEPMFRSNIDYVQMLDQNHGGGQYFCYAEDHGHPPAPGEWMTSSMTELLFAWQSGAPGKAFGCESAAAEPYIGKLLFSDNRYSLNWRIGSPVPLYSFLYHEYLHNFMGNQVCAGLTESKDSYRVRLAYSFVAGDCMTLIINPEGKILPRWGYRVGDGEMPDTDKALNFIESLVCLMNSGARKYLLEGRAVRMPELKCMSERYECDTEGYIDIPNVFGAKYELNGKIMTVLVNHTDKDQQVTLGGEVISVPKLGGRLFFDKK